MEEPDNEIKRHVGMLLGFSPTHWTAVHRGYTPAKRYIVRDGSRSAFVKIGATPLTARLLNREIGIYRNFTAPCMPRILGYRLDQTAPILAIEDLSTAYWPPPWDDATTTSVLEQIRALHRLTGNLERRGLLHGDREAGWPTVARDPGPFLSLGLVSGAWLDKALPLLIEAERQCPLDGDAVTHLDLRSDNICVDKGVVKFVDWAEAGIGNASVDLGFFLPSLAYEGGPQPDAILPGSPEIAALVAGFFAARAGLPSIPDAPFVRRVQQQQLSTALPWAQRALGLDALDG